LISTSALPEKGKGNFTVEALEGSMRKLTLVLVLALAAMRSEAQNPRTAGAKDERPLTGNPRFDLLQSLPLVGIDGRLQEQTPAMEARRKSPWLAAGMSLVLPGSGEFYAESYWKSALFLAVEVGTWALAYHFDKKGDRQTDFFQGYADQHWSVVQYATYTINNLIPADQRQSYYDRVIIPGTASLPPWDRVNWDALNSMEREIGGFYSHTLPRYGEQQYYELIGKYPQFNQGWDDANLSLPADYFVIKDNLTQRYLYYSAERGKANDYYRNATTFVTVAVVNHVISAIDAAWSVSSYNRNLVQGTVQAIPGPGGIVYVPAVRVQYSF
jgi:hypothetical protein